jgi:hypothetical protein
MKVKTNVKAGAYGGADEPPTGTNRCETVRR